jgi:hypothetical protein
MMRTRWAVLIVLATAAASPPRSLPVPPIPPADPPSGQSAPMPDRDALAPHETVEQTVRVRVRDFRADRVNQGMAYTPGSQFQTSEDKRPIQTPGFTVEVPLR